MSLKYDYGLPSSLEGKSFADASKHIEKTFKNRMSNIDIRTKQELMSRLRDAQEVQRQQMEQKNPTNQFYDGGSLEYDATQEHNEILQPYSGTSWLQRTVANAGNWLNKNDGENKQSVLGGLGLAATAIAPMISNRRAMKSLKPPTELQANLINENQYQPNFVNRQQLLRNAAEQLSSQRYLMNQAGGNWAQRSAMLANMNTAAISGTGNLMLQSDQADIQEKARIQGMRGSVQQFNAQQSDRIAEINAQNRAAYQSTLAAYKQATGANFAAIGQTLFNAMQAQKYGKNMGYAAALKQ